MSDSLFTVFTAHCFWAPRCNHVERALTSQAVSAAMERHYKAEHADDIRRIVGWFGSHL